MADVSTVVFGMFALACAPWFEKRASHSARRARLRSCVVPCRPLVTLPERGGRRRAALPRNQRPVQGRHTYVHPFQKVATPASLATCDRCSQSTSQFDCVRHDTRDAIFVSPLARCLSTVSPLISPVPEFAIVFTGRQFHESVKLILMVHVHVHIENDACA